MRFELLGIFLSLTLLISGFGYGVNYADAKGPDEPCNYLDRHHSLKISYDGSKYPGVTHCEKVDYWVPERCGKIAGLYKTDSACQPPAVPVSEPVPTPAPAPVPTPAGTPAPTKPDQLSPTDGTIAWIGIMIMFVILSILLSKKIRMGRKRRKRRKGTKERQQISGDVRHAVYLRDNYSCCICGKGVEDYDLQIDHIKPISKGGTNAMSNLQTLCEDCNKEKGNKWKGKGHSYRD